MSNQFLNFPSYGINSDATAYLNRQLTPWATSATNIYGTGTVPPVKASLLLFDQVSWRFIGNSMQMMLQFAGNGTNVGTAGSSGSSYVFPVPGGFSINSSVCSVTTNLQRAQLLGFATIGNTGANLVGFASAVSSTGISIFQLNSASNNALIGPGTSDVSDSNVFYAFNILIPIAGL